MFRSNPTAGYQGHQPDISAMCTIAYAQVREHLFPRELLLGWQYSAFSSVIGRFKINLLRRHHLVGDGLCCQPDGYSRTEKCSRTFAGDSTPDIMSCQPLVCSVCTRKACLLKEENFVFVFSTARGITCWRRPAGSSGPRCWSAWAAPWRPSACRPSSPSPSQRTPTGTCLLPTGIG